MVPIVGVLAAAALIVMAVHKDHTVAIAGYIVLALSAVFYFYLRSR